MARLRVRWIMVAVTLVCPPAVAWGWAQTLPERCNPNLLPERDSVVFSVPPRLLNGSAARRAVATAYPRALRRAGIGGTAWVAVLILHDGTMAGARLTASAGHPALDSAAVRVARGLEFAPPHAGAEATCGWFEIPIRFTAPGRDAAGPAHPLNRR